MSMIVLEKVEAPYRHLLSIILEDEVDERSTLTTHLEHGYFLTRMLSTPQAGPIFILLLRRDIPDIEYLTVSKLLVDCQGPQNT